MPQSPVSSGMPPSEVTASTTVSAPLAADTPATSAIGFSTPVDVSACTIATMSAPCASSARLTAVGSAARPGRARPPVLPPLGIAGPAPLVVNRPDGAAVAGKDVCQPLAEIAADHDKYCAPGFVTFATAASIPDVPVPETASDNAPSPAPNTRCRLART